MVCRVFPCHASVASTAARDGAANSATLNCAATRAMPETSISSQQATNTIPRCEIPHQAFHRQTVSLGKEKAHAPFEFGVNVSLATTSAVAPDGQFVVGAQALPGNLHDGHTLAAQIGIRPPNRQQLTRDLTSAFMSGGKDKGGLTDGGDHRG